SLFTLRGLDDLLSSISQTFCSDDVQTTFSQHFCTQLGIVAFQTYNHRNFHTHFFNCTDDAFSNHVAAYDTAEDVNQYGFNVGIRQNDFECFSHTFFGCTTTYVEEVGRFATVQVNDVHGAHGQT